MSKTKYLTLEGRSYYIDGVKTTFEEATKLNNEWGANGVRKLSNEKYRDFIFLLRRVVIGQLSEEGEAL
jgi:hypothetical protein|tara:strand:+ start:1442 stop:1648 length:207 start_codon:yes stop_codon:yes gene_type:complete